MSKGRIILLIVAGALLITGGIIFGVALKKGINHKADAGEKKTYNSLGAFDTIEMEVDTSDINIRKSTDGKNYVEVYEYKEVVHEVKVEDGKLLIKSVDNRKWYDFIFGFNFMNLQINVYLDNTEYAKLKIKASTADVTVDKEFVFGDVDIHLSTGDVEMSAKINNEFKVETSTGDVRFKGNTAKMVNIDTDTGRVYLENVDVSEDLSIKVTTGNTSLKEVTAKNLKYKASTGDIKLVNTVIANHIEINTSTGDVDFDHCDASTLTVKTTTGHVKGSLLTPKSFWIETDTGKRDVPRTTGGDCEITTDTGDIKITVVNNE